MSDENTSQFYDFAFLNLFYGYYNNHRLSEYIELYDIALLCLNVLTINLINKIP